MPNRRGREQPNLDNTGQPDLFTDTDTLIRSVISQRPEDSPSQDESPPSTFEEMLPEGVKRDLQARRQAQEEEWERLDKQAIHSGITINEKIGRTALIDNGIDRPEIPKAPNRARDGSKGKRSRPLGPRQLNIADGDMRVKNAYPETDR